MSGVSSFLINRVARPGDAAKAPGPSAEAPIVTEARALVAKGELRDAQRQLERHLKKQRDDRTAWWLLVDCREKQEEWRKARHLVRQLLVKHPRDAEGHNRLGLIESRLGNGAAAVEAFAVALAEDPDNVGFLLNQGRILQSLRRLSEALPILERAHALLPNFETVFSLASVLVQLYRFEPARPLMEEARRLVPDTPNALFLLAQLLHRAGEHVAAKSCYQRVLETQPDLEWVVNSFQQCFQGNFTDTVRTHLPAVLERFPEEPRLQYQAANLEYLDGHLEEARERLHSIELGISDFQRLFLLGQVEDRLKNAEDAMAAFERANQLQGEVQDGARLAARYWKRLETLEQALSPTRLARWTTPSSLPDDGPPPVFLVGFPRSGTTLLDTILMSHPAVTVIEEAPTLKGLENYVKLGTKKENLECLDHLTDRQEWADLRRDYRERIAAHHDGTRPIVIDKMPLNLPKAGVIHRFFPEAKFILALRHPCDAVFSSFMQSFRLNPAMANLLDLGDAARLYDRVMALWCRYDDLLPLQSCAIRYEDLIQDVRGEMTTLLDFLGLDYDPAMEDHTRTARARGFISTPSSNQVAQPLYHRAAGRWQRYAKAMAPVLPVLEPWIRHWGYEEASSKIDNTD